MIRKNVSKVEILSDATNETDGELKVRVNDESGVASHDFLLIFWEVKQKMNQSILG